MSRRRPRTASAQVPASNLNGCPFQSEDFSGDNLSGFKMIATNFRDATLVGTNLSSSNAKGAVFRGANLCGANLALLDAHQRRLPQRRPDQRQFVLLGVLAGRNSAGATFCNTRTCTGAVRRRRLPGQGADTCCGCGPDDICDRGTCVACDTGQTHCGAACVDTQNDPAHCGGCGNACPERTGARNPGCSGGACTLVCDAGWADCDGDPANGCETNLGNPSNCLGCGDACSGGDECRAGPSAAPVAATPSRRTKATGAAAGPAYAAAGGASEQAPVTASPAATTTSCDAPCQKGARPERQVLPRTARARR